jgi:hypothetical protein
MYCTVQRLGLLWDDTILILNRIGNTGNATHTLLGLAQNDLTKPIPLFRSWKLETLLAIMSLPPPAPLLEP